MWRLNTACMIMTFSWLLTLLESFLNMVGSVVASKISQTLLQPDNQLQYGLKVMQVDPESKRVFSVRCEFFMFFGRTS